MHGERGYMSAKDPGETICQTIKGVAGVSDASGGTLCVGARVARYCARGAGKPGRHRETVTIVRTAN